MHQAQPAPTEPRKFNKRDQAIIDWCKEHRPDTVDHMTKLLLMPDNTPMKQATLLTIVIGFEAGRKFQAETGMELNACWLY